MWRLLSKRQLLFKVEICIEKDGESYYAFCPALKGVHVDGATPEEASKNAKTAVELYIQSLIKHNEPIPIQPEINTCFVAKKPQKKSASYYTPQSTQVSVCV